MAEAVFCGIFNAPIRWADDYFGIAFDFFAEKFGRNEVPTNCEADFAKASLNYGWLVATFEHGAFGMEEVDFAVFAEDFAFAVDVVSDIVEVTFGVFDARAGNDVDFVLFGKLLECFEAFFGFFAKFFQVATGTARVVAEDVFGENN